MQCILQINTCFSVFFGYTDINKKLRISGKIATLLMLFILVFPMKGWSQSGDAAVEELIKMGFENVSCTDTDDERVYVVQNMAYRLHGVGMAKAVDVILSLGMPSDKNCRIVVLDNNVPQYSIFHQKGGEVNDTIALEGIRAGWETTYLLGDSWEVASKTKKQNSSLFKVDLVVYPEFYFQNMLLNKIYTSSYSLDPTIEVSLWKGMKFTGQVVIPLHRGGRYGEIYGKTRLGYLTVSQSFRVQNLFVTAFAGNLGSFHWGLGTNMKYVFKDPRFSIEGHAMYVGVSTLGGWKWERGELDTWLYKLSGLFYWPKYNTQFELRLEKYVRHDTGLYFQFARHMRKASIGFYARKTIDYNHRYKIANSGYDGGLFFTIALPPYGKYKRTKHIPRITPAETFGITYYAGNEKYYGKTVNYSPSNNARIRNSNFNPIFIKSELLNY